MRVAPLKFPSLSEMLTLGFVEIQYIDQSGIALVRYCYT